MRPYEESLEGGPLEEERGLLLRVAVVLVPLIQEVELGDRVNKSISSLVIIGTFVAFDQA